jgi:hypothetical protein
LQAQVQLQLARVFEQVNLRLAVSAEREPPARAHEFLRVREDAVAQVALGRRADAGMCSCQRHPARLFRRHVYGVDGREILVQQPELFDELDGRARVLFQAGCDFRWLLRDVHVQGEFCLALSLELGHAAQIIQRQSPHAVKRHARPGPSARVPL